MYLFPPLEPCFFFSFFMTATPPIVAFLVRSSFMSDHRAPSDRFFHGSPFLSYAWPWLATDVPTFTNAQKQILNYNTIDLATRCSPPTATFQTPFHSQRNVERRERLVQSRQTVVQETPEKSFGDIISRELRPGARE